MKKVCIITGTRAEYGLLNILMDRITKDVCFELQILVTGMHLSPEFGLTYKEIENDGFNINRKVEMLLSADSPSAILKSTGLGLIGFADVFEDLKPDIIILVGDRFEMLAAAFAACVLNVPIAHLHGGETTEGAFDESIRHSITKMSWWHFVATDEYKKRVIQLGEDPKRVFMVGGLGVDSIVNTKLLDKTALEKSIGLKFEKKNLLITFHPVTLENESTKTQFYELLYCLENMKDINLIFTRPNSDTDGRIINQMIDSFISNYSSNSVAYISMGHLNYLSTLQYVDAVIGNSSSGLSEAPTFKIGTINIGDRQKGRIRPASVIDCEPDRQSISNALKKLYSKEFQAIIKNVKNPYGEGGASEKIFNILKNKSLPSDLKKKFCDL
jgi:GDP/UDP-N,N'-diacetylbacillosamine 2-epimerase (hydrolysing)